MNQSPKHKFFCSWSGGKDCCLSLYRAVKEGHECASLFTMIDETGNHSRSHGLTPETLGAQAQSMGIPLRTIDSTWDSYEKHFKDQAVCFKNENIVHGVFGDIDLEPHREWVVRVCGESGITPHLPLWKENRRKLVMEFLDAGFQAKIVVINTSKMPERFLGRSIDHALIGELESIGVDACGENGEFHTFVYDGPLFKKKLNITQGTIVRKDEYIFSDLIINPSSNLSL